MLTLQDQHGEKSEAAKPDVTSTPSKKLGLFWDRSSEAAKLEEELMTTKLHETAAVAELKEARLKVRDYMDGGVEGAKNDKFKYFDKSIGNKA